MSEFWLVLIGWALAMTSFVTGWIMCEHKWKKAFPLEGEE